jgi:NADPH:quinone reductase-like Zn-dependent oxidoreductase
LAFVGLFEKLGLLEASPEGKLAAGADQVTLLVWGASLSLDSYVTQLATISGFNTVAVAGEARESVQSLCIDASKIVDYRGDRATVIANLNKAAGGRPFTHAFDYITSTETLYTIVELSPRLPKGWKSDQGAFERVQQCGGQRQAGKGARRER